MNMQSIELHLDQLERFHLALMYGAKLPAEDIDYVFSLLRIGNMQLAKGAIFIIAQLPKPQILKLLKSFSSYQYKIRKLIILHLVTTNYVEVYSFLLDLLVNTKNKDLIQVLTICLAGTPYMLFPLILLKMHTATKNGKTNLSFLLHRMGFKKCEPYLAALPYIPHEVLFRQVFGDRLIDQVKR